MTTNRAFTASSLSVLIIQRLISESHRVLLTSVWKQTFLSKPNRLAMAQACSCISVEDAYFSEGILPTSSRRGR